MKVSTFNYLPHKNTHLKMFSKVLILTVALAAVCAQDHYNHGHQQHGHQQRQQSHGHAVSSQSFVLHEVPHSEHHAAAHRSSYEHSAPSHQSYEHSFAHHAPSHHEHVVSVHHAAPAHHNEHHGSYEHHATPVHHAPAHHEYQLSVHHAPHHQQQQSVHHEAPEHHSYEHAPAHHAPSHHEHVVSVHHAAPAHHEQASAHHAAPAYYAVPAYHAAPAHHEQSSVHHAAPVHNEAPVHDAASAQHEQQHYEQEHQDYYAHPKYEYEYKVQDPHTGDNKYQHESRDGDVVKGVYSLHEADGSVRTVQYDSNKHSGFNAYVKHSEPSKHIQPQQYHYHH